MLLMLQQQYYTKMTSVEPYVKRVQLHRVGIDIGQDSIFTLLVLRQLTAPIDTGPACFVQGSYSGKQGLCKP